MDYLLTLKNFFSPVQVYKIPTTLVLGQKRGRGEKTFTTDALSNVLT